METTIIHCHQCEAKVQANILAKREYEATRDWDAYRYIFAECTHCQSVLVGHSEYVRGYGEDEEEGGWEHPTRKWPRPDSDLDLSIPTAVSRSLEEAKRCYSSRAYMACAVMCGRAVEALCKEKVKSKTLADGLKKLKAERIIDDKLYDWSDALRRERNIGAHAGEESTSSQDARDVLDFAVAICEYVYVLDEKYKAYAARKPGKAESAA